MKKFDGRKFLKYFIVTVMLFSMIFSGFVVLVYAIGNM